MKIYLATGGAGVISSTLNHIRDNEALKDILPMQLGDVNRTFADISKAKRLIGYEPKTNFDEGMRKFVDWYKNENRL